MNQVGQNWEYFIYFLNNYSNQQIIDSLNLFRSEILKLNHQQIIKNIENIIKLINIFLKSLKEQKENDENIIIQLKKDIDEINEKMKKLDI